jgi:hypothetical protein
LGVESFAGIGKKYIKSYSPKIPLQGVKAHSTPKIPLQGAKAHGTPKIPLQGAKAHVTPKIPLQGVKTHGTPKIPPQGVPGARPMWIWFLGGQSGPAVFVLQGLGLVVVLGQHARALPVDALVVV